MRQLTARVTEEIRGAVANISNSLLPALDNSVDRSDSEMDDRVEKSSRPRAKAKASGKR